MPGVTECCLGTLCCMCCCTSCGTCGVPRKLFSRLGYVFITLVWIVFGIIMLFYGNYLFDIFNRFLDCPTDQRKDSCLQISVIFRISLTLVLFHSLMFLICLCPNKISSAINEGAWPIKIAIQIGVFIAVFFINNSGIKIFGYIGMVISGFFLIYEMILLIDIAYVWNDTWVNAYDKSEEANSGNSIVWMVLLIIFTFIFYAGGLAICIVLYVYHATPWWSSFLTSLTIVAGIIYTGISISRLVEKGSIFTCGLIFLFTSCLNASIVLSDPKETTRADALLQIFIGIFFLYLALLYVSGTTADTGEELPSQEGHMKAPKIMNGAGNVVMEKKEENQNVAAPPVRSTEADEPAQNYALPELTLATALFHLLMVFASFYIGMLISNWGVPNLSKNEKNYLDFSKEWLGFSMKVIAQWSTVSLFIWSLIAPKCCPNREFS